MIVIFFRHGAAEEKGHGVPGEDEHRRLVKRGKRETAIVAQALDRLKLRPDVILSSPLVRAVETAEVVTRHIKRAPAHDIAKALEPGHKWKDVLSAIKRSAKADSTVMVVGHQPDLGDYIVQALGSSLPQGAEFPLEKSGCVALEWAGMAGDGEVRIRIALGVAVAERIGKL